MAESAAVNGGAAKRPCKIKQAASESLFSHENIQQNDAGIITQTFSDNSTQTTTSSEAISGIGHRHKRRRSSIAESPALLKKLGTFTPEPIEVGYEDEEQVEARDSGHGKVQLKVPDISANQDGDESSLDDDPVPTHTILRAGGAEISVPREARNLIGLLETALAADSTLKYLDCAKVTPWSLKIIQQFIDWRVANYVSPFTITVSSPVSDLLISDRFEIELLNKCSVTQLFELAFAAEYLQLDPLLDTIYKFIIIILSKATEAEIVNLLETSVWSKDNAWAVDLDEHTVKTPTDDEIDSLALDADERYPGLQQVILLLPASDPKGKETNLNSDGFSGTIANVLSRVQKGELKLSPALKSLPLHCWHQIAEISCVNRNFCVTRKQAKLSVLLVNIGIENTKTIRVKKVDSKTLNHVCRYLRHHDGVEPAEIPKPIRSVKMEKIVGDPWDATFINALPKRDIFQLTLAANYMDIKSLLHLACAKVATMIKGKSPDEIKEILGD